MQKLDQGSRRAGVKMADKHNFIGNKQNSGGPPSGFGEGVNTYLNQHITVADAKIVALIGANLTISVLLLASQPSSYWTSISNWVAVITLGLSALLGVFALYPRLIGTEKGLIFWEDIASRKTPLEYLSAVQHLNPQQIESEYAIHNFYTSKILCAKYRTIQWCARLFMIGIVFAFLRFVLV